MCSRLDEQEALFARVQKSTCAEVMPTVCIMLGLAESENELSVSNKMHCICFLQKQFHTPPPPHTHSKHTDYYNFEFVSFDGINLLTYIHEA